MSGVRNGRSGTPVLLVLDEDPAEAGLVERFAQAHAFEVVIRNDAVRIFDELPGLRPDAALVDVGMPEIDGLEILHGIHDIHPACEVILTTAHASANSATEAIKLGALDYIGKPLDLERLGELLETVRYGIRRRERLLAADSQLASQFEFYGLIGRSPAMQELFDTVRRLAPHVRTALITGETGTGKELVARALHRLGSRRERRFVAFNCSAIAETVFESEFFGHARGAFTGATDQKAGLFEHADGGTLFLDEIGELPLSVQPKLLRAVEYGEIKRVGSTDSKQIDVRVIAATNRDLADETIAGRFRRDLYYRLNIVEFRLPPLREHREDIPYLTAAFVKEFSNRFNKAIAGVSPGAERLLQKAPWPGNVRELRNVLERACMSSESRILTERAILSALGGSQPANGRSQLPAAEAAVPVAGPAATEIPRERIEHAMQQSGGNRSAAARVLGISRRALYRRLDTFGLR